MEPLDLMGAVNTQWPHYGFQWQTNYCHEYSSPRHSQPINHTFSWGTVINEKIHLSKMSSVNNISSFTLQVFVNSKPLSFSTGNLETLCGVLICLLGRQSTYLWHLGWPGRPPGLPLDHRNQRNQNLVYLQIHVYIDDLFSFLCTHYTLPFALMT